MAEMRVPDERYAAMADELIDSDPALSYIAESGVDIVYLASDSEKKKSGRVIYGECEKVPNKWKWAAPYDFAITIYQPNVERFTEAQLRILLLHELLHVGVEVDGNEEKYFVSPHDYEEFTVILRRYGGDWDVTSGEA